MSYDIRTLVSKKRIGSQTKKCVLLQLSSYASDDGSGIWASKSRIAKILEMSDRTVQRAIKELVADGVLIEAGTRDCKNGYTVDYTISISKLHTLDDLYTPLTESHPCQSDTPTPDTVSPLPPSQCHPNNNKNNNKNNNNTSSNDDALDYYLEELWDWYPRKVGKGQAKKALKAALKKVSFDEIYHPFVAYVDTLDGKDKKFIPHLSTWLNGERWADEEQ